MGIQNLFYALIVSFQLQAAEVGLYKHVHTVATRMMDVATGDPRTLATVPMAKTRYFATVDFYFVPGDTRATSFVRGRFNARRLNHAWLNADTGYLPTESMPSAEYSAMLRQNGTKEPGFGENSLIFVSQHLNETVETAVKSLQHIFERTRGRSPLIVGLDFAVPPEAIVQPPPAFNVTFRASYEDYDYVDFRQTVNHRKYYLGTATPQPLTEDETRDLRNVLLLDHACESGVTAH